MVKRPVDFLSPTETFEHYEKRSPMSSANSSMHNVSTPVRTASLEHGTMACEYRAAPYGAASPASVQGPGQLACEYRQAIPAGPRTTEFGVHPQKESPSVSTRITSYLPTKKKIPMGYVIGVAVCVPIFLMICLFGAVWFQELGIL